MPDKHFYHREGPKGHLYFEFTIIFKSYIATRSICIYIVHNRNFGGKRDLSKFYTEKDRYPDLR